MNIDISPGHTYIEDFYVSNILFVCEIIDFNRGYYNDRTSEKSVNVKRSGQLTQGEKVESGIYDILNYLASTIYN